MHQVEILSYPHLLDDSSSSVQNQVNYGDTVDQNFYQLDNVPQREVIQKNNQMPLAHVMLPQNYAKFPYVAPMIPIPRMRPAYLDRKTKNNVTTARRDNIENKVIKNSS